MPDQQRMDRRVLPKHRKSRRLHRNIPSPREPVKAQQKPRLSSGGTLCGRNGPL